MVEKLKVSVPWLRIALLLCFVAGLLATMVAETSEYKISLGALFSALLGFLWAVLLHSASKTDHSNWDLVTRNVREAQNLINQSVYSSYRRKLLGLQPKPDIESMDIMESLESPLSIGLFVMLSVVLGLNPNLLGYVFSFQQQNPPLPKTALFYLGFMFCLSTAFLGIFLWVIKRVQS